MEAVVHEPLGNIHHGNVILGLLFIGKDHFVQNGFVVREIIHLQQFLLDVVGIQDGHAAGLSQAGRAICQDVAKSPNQGPKISIKGFYLADGLGTMVVEKILAFRILFHSGVGKKGLDNLFHGYRTRTGPTPSVGSRKSFVEIQGHYIHSEIPRSCQSH